ncbi:MAG: CHAD domain-containing protein [Thiohalocapsa sp.]|nr:CHAD domain-containing protein [Thiohalocapsa sp.]MCF7992229.1 CHAD domain-containing protein [Thiohalocapsa sp.]
MQLEPRVYAIPEGSDGTRMAMALSTRLHCDAAAPVKLPTRWLDSFDWRLYAAGAALEEIGADTGRELVWHDLADGGASVVRQRIPEEPGFAQAMAPGPVRERLLPLLGIRRLLPLLDLDIGRRSLNVLDDEDKTVVRILIEEPRLRADNERAELPLSGRVRLLPVRGYGDALREVADLLEGELGLAAVYAPVLLEALSAAGIHPCSYSPKLDYRLDPRQRADAAAKEIHLGLLDTLSANVQGTIDNLDSEFLHDLRVATRRARSALTQIKGVFPEPVVADMKERFGWLQRVTGPVRDLDVYLLDFPVMRESLPAPLRGDLEPLRTFVLSHYDQEQRKLAAMLESPQLHSLLRDWRAFLEAPVPQAAAPINAMRPVKDVADARIGRMYRRVRREGRAITGDSPPEDLHELRKSCKKLRYLMEFFQSLYPQEEMRGLIKQTKTLLDNLGRFQDLAVQAEHLRETALAMHDEGMHEVGTMLAMGALMRDLLAGQQAARAEFAVTFERFDTRRNRATFEALFRARGGRR